MDLALLRLFQDVVQAGSFAAAARRTNIDASIVSRRIAHLETSLGYRLFDRTTRRLVLTEAGSMTLERIDGPLAELESLRDDALATLEEPVGILRLTMSTAFAERWLVPRLSAFTARFPRIQPDLIVSDSRIDLVADRVDLAIRLGPVPEGDNVTRKLMDVHYHAVAARTLALSLPADLADQAIIAFPFAGYRSLWRFKRDQVVEEIAVKPRYTISNALVQRRAVLDGLGVALLPHWAVAEDLERGSMVDLFPDHAVSAGNFDSAAWLLYPSRGSLPARARSFADWVVEETRSSSL